MLFNSLHYLIFFPLVACVYFALPFTARRYWLLAASFYFYCVFSIPLSLLMVYSTVLGYFCARIIDANDAPWKRKAALMVSLIGNLCVLFVFKYVDFFAQSINAVAGKEMVPAFEVILPMGISFYTFQILAYTIDVYRRQIAAERSFINVALYVAYFPQLVAGPIMRASDLLPQFMEKHEINTTRILSGFLLLSWGLSKKIFIAEPMGQFVDPVYADPESYSGGALLLATYAFSIQIFADFSAYTDIAIGSARILGFRLMENFKQPYLATSIQDFWRRWHISLSTWLRDYLYIAMGGNRKGRMRTYANLMITMLLGGLWHGASWNFVIWGGLHGAALALERILTKRGDTPTPRNCWNELSKWFFTFHFICLAWIFFRAKTFDAAINIIGGIASWQEGAFISYTPLAVLAALLATQFLQTKVDVHGYFLRHAFMGRWLAYIGILLCALAMAGGSSPEFIYFQF
jgi:alginate O-acetyltransferase complex protein AlgI